ncbi:MAG: type II methionyl aminopeptidase [Candidatus Pacearchaeota archaeon]
MTEKQYGGITGRGIGKIGNNIDKSIKKDMIKQNRVNSELDYYTNKNKIKEEPFFDKEKIIKAGKIASEVKKYAREIIKPGINLLEIAEAIETKINELGGKPAFPVNLSINNIAAHYTPNYDDKLLAYGLLKVDFGVHVDGWIADNSFSIDLENKEENKKLIKASEEALSSALKILRLNTPTNKIGQVISETIELHGFNPIVNLSGHSMDYYKLHAGINIPNINDNKQIILKEGLYAIEPFATNGSGKIHEGKPSGIYELRSEKTPRSQTAREVLEFIKKEYKTLPFCSRWIVKKFGLRALFGLKNLEDNGNLYQFSQLVEISNAKVSQAEQTILITNSGEVIITTL